MFEMLNYFFREYNLLMYYVVFKNLYRLKVFQRDD